ncbi:hypothetical protein THASP1DRAFT_32342 [Thamnocephalis sphaerospora]|uniref:Cation-transporting P-type ATPase C-terminal domain-containing protein n=1 Tax=Thamnocephalis sphaerospora TaxID=78915 RepID=A0A4P9XJA4_9FUNG|nr:hypothetical protein THASP1DRAFT_32342 [Thamnocephalis sphaerospora]|eukprot:RKP05825.1 hypothetical protein THASP1DRAFT_32342 [Thamnocephalis sphaerospora]
MATHGLTDTDAERVLFEDLKRETVQHRSCQSKAKLAAAYLWQFESIATLVCGLVLFAYAGYVGALLHVSVLLHGTEDLAAGVIVLVILVLNGVIYVREQQLRSTEVARRAQLLVDRLCKYAFNYAEANTMPDMPSVRTVTVVRGGVRRRIFTNLLAKGDVIELTLGELAPADARPLVKPAADDNGRSSNLARNCPYLPTKDDISAPLLAAGGVAGQFVLQETPFAHTLREMLTTKRPKGVQEQELLRLRVLWRRGLWAGLGISVLISTLRFVLLDIVQGESTSAAFSTYMEVVYTLLPVLPLGCFVLVLFCRLCASARLISLFELLQASESVFEEREDVDEFDDEAPPPTKDVHVDFVHLCRKMLAVLRGRERRYLTRSVDLVDSLGNITSLCALDREGTLCMPVPSPVQLLVPNADDDMVMLDVEEDPVHASGVRFEDLTWDSYLSTLKPLGLNLLLNAHCGTSHPPVHADAHFKYSGAKSPLRLPTARQACLCRIGAEIGFTTGAVECFRQRGRVCGTRIQNAETYLRNAGSNGEQPTLSACLYEEQENGNLQLLSEGDVGLVLDCCEDYWDGQQLEPMDDSMRQRLLDFCQTAAMNDLACIAFAYRPISTDADTADANKTMEWSTDLQHRVVFFNTDAASLEKDTRLQALQQQIFLGMVTLSLQPKMDVRDFIEDLNTAGIRFVYFAPQTEQECKAFGDRVGLETDWNSCILLSSADKDGLSRSAGYVEQHDIKARLPHGTEQIRRHLQHVDDIPLHVPLFAECSPPATTEMMCIFQEYGDVVCAVGSVLNDRNALQFAMADIGIGVEPLPRHFYRDRPENGRVSALVVSTMLNRLACSLTMQHETSLYALNQMIGEARQFQIAYRQAIIFYATSSASLGFLSFLSNCMVLPPALSATQLLWISFLLVPALAFSLVNAPQDPGIMKLMPERNAEHLVHWKRQAFYQAVRACLSVAMCLVIFVLSLAACLNVKPTVTFTFLDRKAWHTMSDGDYWALRYAQQCCGFAFVYFTVWSSATFQHRTHSIIHTPPYKNLHWLITVIFVLVLELVLFFAMISGNSAQLSSLPWYLYILLFAWPLVFMPVHELIKWRDGLRHVQLQKRLKLEFNTKLGMHSPV